MKLATRYQRSHLISTLVIFLLASAAFYFLLHRVLLFQMDEDLEIEQHEIETYVQRYHALPQNVLPVEDQIVNYEKVAAPLLHPIRQTRTMRDEAEHTSGPFRQLIFTVRVDQDCYKASVSKSLEATEGLTREIGLIALSIIALLLLISFLINRLVLRRLWKPFYKTINRLKKFGLEDSRGLNLPHVPTEEFALLNKTLSAAADKAVRDYTLLKEFTENAAHELQTPLAIVRSKLDLLIQDEAMSESQSRMIHDAYTAIARMTHLNQSLLELAKIEGGQYDARSVVDMKSILSEKLSVLEDMLQDKHIELRSELNDSLVLMHPALAEMLLNNLLTNAIHHNVEYGRIVVALDAEHLSVCNTSYRGPLKRDNLFVRFSKSGEVSSGTGLGLAISKQICDASGCRIEYAYSEGRLHCFTVFWQGARAVGAAQKVVG